MPLPITQAIDYYTDDSLHGNYQYVTLEDIVNNYIMSGQDDDYTSNVDKYKVLFQARRAFRELYFDVMQEIKGISLDLSPQLNVTLPQDYVNYVRISWLDSLGKLHPMAANDKLSIATEYLQDNEFELLFDNEGDILEGSGLEVTPSVVQTEANQYYQFCGNGFTPNINLSNVYSNGSFRVDKNNGLIKFGSEISSKTIVLEYISDGLFTNSEGAVDLRIHKFAETAVYDWMYWKLVERRRNVPANEKARARKEWFNSRRLVKRRISTIRADELRQVFKGTNKWVKGE